MDLDNLDERDAIDPAPYPTVPEDGPTAGGPADEGPAYEGPSLAPPEAPSLAPPAQPLPVAQDENAWPPPVPAEAPGMVPVAPPLGAVDEKPTAAKTPAGLSEKVIEDTRKLDTETAKLKTDIADREATAADAEARRQDDLRVQAQADRQQAVDRLNSRIDEYEKTKELRDPRESWTTTDKVRNAVAIAFGGLGAALSAAGGGNADNPVIKQIEDRLAKETDRQKFNIANAKDSVVMARAGVQDADEARRLLFQDEDARRVARLKVAEAQGRAQLLAQGVPAANIDADARMVALRKARIEAARKAEDDAAKRAEQAARTRWYDAKAGRLKGGGGVSSKEQRAIDAANRSERRIDLTERRAVDTELNRVADSLGLPALEKKQRELKLVQRGLNGDQNALTQAFSLMEVDKASKGGTATAASLNAVASHFGGSSDRVAGWLQRAKDGQLPPAQLKVLKGAVDKALSGVQAEGDEAHNNWQQTVRENPLYAEDPKVVDIVNAHSDRHFGQFGYSRKPAAPAAAPPKGDKPDKGGGLSADQVTRGRTFIKDNSGSKDPTIQAQVAHVKALLGPLAN